MVLNFGDQITKNSRAPKEALLNSSDLCCSLLKSVFLDLLDEGKFDFVSTSNLHHLEIHAGKFLTHMHNQLKEELHQEHNKDTDG